MAFLSWVRHLAFLIHNETLPVYFPRHLQSSRRYRYRSLPYLTTGTYVGEGCCDWFYSSCLVHTDHATVVVSWQPCAKAAAAARLGT
jgi:hypothetical protein